MPSARGNMGADIVGNRVHVIGGRDASGASALHQAYDPAQERVSGQPLACAATSAAADQIAHLGHSAEQHLYLRSAG